MKTKIAQQFSQPLRIIMDQAKHHIAVGTKHSANHISPMVMVDVTPFSVNRLSTRLTGIAKSGGLFGSQSKLRAKDSASRSFVTALFVRSVVSMPIGGSAVLAPTAWPTVDSTLKVINGKDGFACSALPHTIRRVYKAFACLSARYRTVTSMVRWKRVVGFSTTGTYTWKPWFCRWDHVNSIAALDMKGKRLWL